MKYIPSLLLVGILLSACQKEETASPADGNSANNNGGLSGVPASFTQKVLIETFTGAGQPQSTDGFVKLNTILSNNAANAIPVSIHYSDALEIAQYTSLSSAYSNNNPMTFPSGMINRTPSLNMTILNRTQWQSNFDLAKSKSAKCGLAIETSVNGTTATAIVHCGFNQNMSGNYTVTAYVVEDNVTATGGSLDQRNAYNNTSGHPFQGAGDPIPNFSHQQVLRKVLSAPLGDAIPASNITNGGKAMFTYTCPLNNYKTNDVSIIAFITRTGSTPTGYEVMNVQKVKIGQTKNWD